MERTIDMTKRNSGYGPSAAVRIRVMKRDRFQCTYCGTPGTDAELEIDHIIPVAKGDSHHMSNLTTACRKCNQSKSDRKAPANGDIRASSGLAGLFFHTLKDGKIHWQGEIIRDDGEDVLAQLFSYLDGGPTKVVAIPREQMKDPSKATLYRSDEDMRYAYDCQYEGRTALL